MSFIQMGQSDIQQSALFLPLAIDFLAPTPYP